MQREEFETRIRELLPGSSEIALATVTTYAEEPDELAIELSDGAGHFYDAFYVNLALVRRDYGEDIAKAYSTTGNGISSTPRSCALWQGWLRRAALWNKLWTASRPSDVCHERRERESQEILSRFQNGEREICAAPFHPAHRDLRHGNGVRRYLYS